MDTPSAIFNANDEGKKFSHMRGSRNLAPLANANVNSNVLSFQRLISWESKQRFHAAY